MQERKGKRVNPGLCDTPDTGRIPGGAPISPGFSLRESVETTSDIESSV